MVTTTQEPKGPVMPKATLDVHVQRITPYQSKITVTAGTSVWTRDVLGEISKAKAEQLFLAEGHKFFRVS